MREAHPLADLLPPTSAVEFVGLRAAIAANGLREPITLHRDGRILDGRHRARACAELGVAPQYRAFEGPDSDALAYVIDLNKSRRHLSEGQKAMLAIEVANMRQGERTDLASPEAKLVSQAEAADRVGVSRSSVQPAAIVKAAAIPAIVDAVRQGQLPVKLAARVAGLSEPGQRQVAAEMHNGKSLSTIILAAPGVSASPRSKRGPPISHCPRSGEDTR